MMNESGLSALRLERTLPCGVFGAVDCSHGRHASIHYACRAFHSGVHPFAMYASNSLLVRFPYFPCASLKVLDADLPQYVTVDYL